MKVKLIPYDSYWHKAFEEESKPIKDILKGLLIDIYHIGSTAVEGLCSRPAIDMMAVVRDIVAIDEIEDSFESLGYESMGEFGITRRRYFRKQGALSFNIHIFDVFSERDIIRHLAFRDYLRAHSKDAIFYASLKISLAKCFASDMEGYSIGKAAYINSIEEKAISWYINKYSIGNI